VYRGVRAAGEARQFGGPVWPGKGYWVGEAGPEFVMPTAPGFVIPNHALNGGSAGPPSMPPIYIHNTVAGEHFGSIIYKYADGLRIEAKRRERGHGRTFN